MHDSSPERRNLIVASLAFIVFFAAGGEITENIVRVQFVNIQFTEPKVLVVLAWTLLCWFAYRYWLTHTGLFLVALDKELRFWSSRAYVRSHIGNRLDKPVVPDAAEGIHIGGIYLADSNLVANLLFAKRIGRDKSTFEINLWDGQKKIEPEQIVFSGVRGFVVKLRIFIECFLAKPSFSSYVVPYVLFVAAISLGVVDAL